MAYSSTRSMADRLGRGLADLQKPTVCPYCLQIFAGRHDDKLTKHMPRLRVDCHALFDACIATLTCTRTSDELDRLALMLYSNRRRCNTHRACCRPFKADEYLNTLLLSAAEIFAMAVRLGDGAFEDRAERANKSFSDKHGRWPARIEQLFPNGVQATVEALLGYCELYISKGPLSMLTVLILVVRPAIMPVLAVDPFRARLVDVVLKMMDPIASGINTRAPWISRQEGSHGYACHVTHVLGVLRDGPGARPNACSRFFVGHESTLLRLLGPITATMGKEDPLLSQLAFCCDELADHCNERVPIHILQWFEAKGHCRCKEITVTTVHTRVMMYRDTRVCAGPSCTLSMFHQENGKPFPACARCRVPRYCSRACQLADWKGEPPHKELCALFCKLNAHTCAPGTLPEFKEVYQRAEQDFSAQEREALAAFVAGDCKHGHSHADA